MGKLVTDQCNLSGPSPVVGAEPMPEGADAARCPETAHPPRPSGLRTAPAFAPLLSAPLLSTLAGRVVAFRAVSVETRSDGQFEHRVELTPGGQMVDRRTTTFSWRAPAPVLDRPAVLSFTASIAEQGVAEE